MSTHSRRSAATALCAIGLAAHPERYRVLNPIVKLARTPLVPGTTEKLKGMLSVPDRRAFFASLGRRKRMPKRGPDRSTLAEIGMLSLLVDCAATPCERLDTEAATMPAVQQTRIRRALNPSAASAVRCG